MIKYDGATWDLRLDLCESMSVAQWYQTLFHLMWKRLWQTVACQVPLSMGFLRQEYWGGLPFPPLGDLPHPGIEPTSLTSTALAGGF